MPAPNPIDDVAVYYDTFGFIYEPIWGANIHWGMFLDENESLATATDRYTRWACSEIRPKAGQTILDIGIGPAYTAGHLISHYGASVIGIDASEYQLARARHAAAAYCESLSLRLMQGNIESQQLRLPLCDGALSQATFFHLRDRFSALRNVAQSIIKGGRFVFDDLIEDTTQDKIDAAFGRIGPVRLETESSYAKLIRQSPFRVTGEYDLSPSVALTYVRLIQKLEDWAKAGDPRLTLPLYQALDGSFRKIIDLVDRSELRCVCWVLTRDSTSSTAAGQAW